MITSVFLRALNVIRSCAQKFVVDLDFVVVVVVVIVFVEFVPRKSVSCKNRIHIHRM